MDFYLASKSPRRRELLKDAGFDFDILLSKTPDSVNEDVLPGESPENYVARVTREKAKWGRKVAETERDLLLPVLAADTTVALNGKIYGKPADEKEAFEFLKDFSGQTHEVLTAVCLVDKEGKPRETLTKTFVTFRPLTDEEINSYIASGEAFDKAGGYGIQGLAGQFVEKVEGSYSGVIGLPVDETKALHAEIGIRPHKVPTKEVTAFLTLRMAEKRLNSYDLYREIQNFRTE